MPKKSKTVKVYKIQCMAEGDFFGLYSTGGQDPDYNERGKTWSSIGALSNHLNITNDEYDDCEIVEIEIKEECVKRTPVKEVLEAKRKKRKEEVEKRKQQEEAEKKERRRLQFEKLSEEFGPKAPG